MPIGDPIAFRNQSSANTEIPVLEMDGERFPVHLLRIDRDAKELLFEILTRIREIQSERFTVHTQEGTKMLIQQIQGKVDVLFNRMIANKLIAKVGMSSVLDQIRNKLKADAEALKPQLEAMFADSGSVDQSIEFLRAYVKGHIKFPWYIAIFGGGNKLVDAAFDYLLKNKDVLKQGIGDLAPVS